ncbi:MAG: hypothetical protein Q9159_004984 [Coniocarpon cinnabarinum]
MAAATSHQGSGYEIIFSNSIKVANEARSEPRAAYILASEPNPGYVRTLFLLMDPLSIGASVIAILQLSASTTKAFRNLRSLCKNFPGRLHALNNEVSDIDLVLHEVAHVARARTTHSAIPLDDSTLQRLLQQAYQKLDEIRIVVLRLTEVSEQARPSLFTAHAWKKNQPRLQTLQEELQAIKCSLNIILGSYHTQDVIRLHVTLEDFHLSTSSSLQHSAGLQNEFQQKFESSHRDIHETISTLYQNVDKRIGDVETLLQQNSSLLKAREMQQEGSEDEVPSAWTTRKSRPQQLALIARHKSIGVPGHNQEIGIRVNKSRPCKTSCTCSCHSQSASLIPSFADRIIGQLFVGYTGPPAFANKCNVPNCSNSTSSQMTVEYWFPLSFIWSSIFRFRLAYSPNIGPQFELTTLRRVPDSAACVHLALRGDIEGLKDLFNRGLASPRDVSSTRGYSVLRWAVYGHQYQTAKFLMQAGADPDYRPIAAHDNTPRHKANQFLLMGGMSGEDADALRTVAQGDDFIDDQNYTSLHKIVLGLLFRNLEEELQIHPELLNVSDAMGRTPLIWAACRGDERAIVSLLQHGAAVDTLDVQHTNAVSYAAERDFAACVRLLLEAGANPNIAEANKLPVADAINVAARNATDPLIIKTLLDFGANPDSRGVDRMTSLIHAARRDNYSFALLLLEHSANINAISSSNMTPLTAAVTNNSHNVLKLLLDRWFEYSECPRLKGPHLLQVVADYADAGTMRLLASTDHLLIKYDRDYLLGNFQTSLNSRLDADEELFREFNDLLSVVRQGSESTRISHYCAGRQTSKSRHGYRDLDSELMESGMLHDNEGEVKAIMQHITEGDGSYDDFEDVFYDATEGLAMRNLHEATPASSENNI